MPYNISRVSHQRTYCKHKSLEKNYTTIDKSKCKGHTEVISSVDKVELKCSVEYQCIKCDKYSMFEVYQANSHSNGCPDFTEKVMTVKKVTVNDNEEEIVSEKVIVHRDAD